MTDDRTLERLVRTVTEQVLQQTGPPAAPQPDWGGQPSGGKVVLLLPLVFRRVHALTEAADKLVHGGHRLHVLATDPVLHALQRREMLQRLGPHVHRAEDGGGPTVGKLCGYDAVVLGSLGFGLGRRLVELEDDDPFVRVVTQAMVRDVPVVAVTDDLKHARVDGVPAMISRGEKLLVELEQMGLSTCTSEGLPEAVQGLVDGQGVVGVGDDLITEDHVRRFAARGGHNLVLPARTIVTPLAETKALELGVTIVKE